MYARLIALCCVLLCSGCSSLSLPTVYRLAQLDPLTADPSGFALQVTLWGGIRITPGTERLSFIATRGATGETLGGPYTLLAVSTEKNEKIYRLTESAASEIRTIQAATRNWETNGSNSLALSFGFESCLEQSPDSPSFAVAIQLAPDTPFRPLLRPTALSRASNFIGEEATRLCTSQ